MSIKRNMLDGIILSCRISFSQVMATSNRQKYFYRYKTYKRYMRTRVKMNPSVTGVFMWELGGPSRKHKQLNLIGLAEGLDKDGVCPEELTSLPLRLFSSRWI